MISTFMQTKVACFLAGLLAGDFKFLKILVGPTYNTSQLLLSITFLSSHLLWRRLQDFSNKNGLAASLDCYERCYDKR